MSAAAAQTKAMHLKEERDERWARERMEAARRALLAAHDDVTRKIESQFDAIRDAKLGLASLGRQPEEPMVPSRIDRLFPFIGAPLIAITWTLGGWSVETVVVGLIVGIAVVGFADGLALQWALQVRDEIEKPPSPGVLVLAACLAAAATGLSSWAIAGAPIPAAAAALVSASCLALIFARAFRIAVGRHAHRVHALRKQRLEETVRIQEEHHARLKSEFEPWMRERMNDLANAMMTENPACQPAEPAPVNARSTAR